MPVPIPTSLYRFIHIDNLQVYLKRKGLFAPNHTPDDGLFYRPIHDVEIQLKRKSKSIPCEPFGTVHDYIPFYFGYLSPMLLKLKSGQVEGYADGQEPLIYLVTSAQNIQMNHVPFVFSDGHGIAAFTKWFNCLDDLDKLDWTIIHQKYWADTTQDMDRQRRKQAEFLVYQFCSWPLIERIGVINNHTKQQVQDILNHYPPDMLRPIEIHRDWYF